MATKLGTRACLNGQTIDAYFNGNRVFEEYDSADKGYFIAQPAESQYVYLCRIRTGGTIEVLDSIQVDESGVSTPYVVSYNSKFAFVNTNDRVKIVAIDRYAGKFDTSYGVYSLPAAYNSVSATYHYFIDKRSLPTIAYASGSDEITMGTISSSGELVNTATSPVNGANFNTIHCHKTTLSSLYATDGGLYTSRVLKYVPGSGIEYQDIPGRILYFTGIDFYEEWIVTSETRTPGICTIIVTNLSDPTVQYTITSSYITYPSWFLLGRESASTPPTIVGNYTRDSSGRNYKDIVWDGSAYQFDDGHPTISSLYTGGVSYSCLDYDRGIYSSYDLSRGVAGAQVFVKCSAGMSRPVRLNSLSDESLRAMVNGYNPQSYQAWGSMRNYTSQGISDTGLIVPWWNGPNQEEYGSVFVFDEDDGIGGITDQVYLYTAGIETAPDKTFSVHDMAVYQYNSSTNFIFYDSDARTVSLINAPAVLAQASTCVAEI